jgi:hypothetical protein
MSALSVWIAENDVGRRIFVVLELIHVGEEFTEPHLWKSITATFDCQHNIQD